MSTETNTVTIENLSLKQVQKLLTQLKGEHKKYSVLPAKAKKMYGYSTGQSGGSGPNATITVSWTTSNPVTEEQFVAQTEHITSQRQEDINRHVTISVDLRHVKSILFRANIDGGVDKVMGELELRMMQLTIYENMLKNLQTTDMSKVTKDVAQAYQHGVQQVTKEGAIDNSFSVTTLVYPKKFLSESVSRLKGEIRELEAKRDELNSRVKVTLTLHADTVKLLGL